MLDTIEFYYGVPIKIFHAVANIIENMWFKDVFWNDFKENINISLKSAVLVLTELYHNY